MFLSEVALAKKDRLLERERAIISGNLPLVADFFERHKVRPISLTFPWRAQLTKRCQTSVSPCEGVQDLFVFKAPPAGCIAYPRLRGNRSALAFCTQLVETTG